MRIFSDRWLACGGAATGLGGGAAISYWIYGRQQTPHVSFWHLPGYLGLGALAGGIAMLAVGFFAPPRPAGSSQAQRGGKGSRNYQANGDLVVNEGASISDVRELALDVFHANSMQLAGIAEDVARSRAEIITERFLTRLATGGDTSTLASPGLQRALFNAQAAFAASGDGDLEQTLVDLLVDRAARPDEFESLVLDEAILAAPKLTTAQRRALAVSFVLGCQHLPRSIDEFYEVYVQANLAPLASALPRSDADYRHIEYVGVASVQEIGINAPFNGLFDMRFFNRGFAEADVPKAARHFVGDEDVFIPCPRDSRRFLITWEGTSRLDRLHGEHSEVSETLDRLDRAGRLSRAEISLELKERAPGLRELVDVWQRSDLSQLKLTTAGLAIGHAYWRLSKGGNTRLGLWLTEREAESWPTAWV